MYVVRYKSSKNPLTRRPKRRTTIMAGMIVVILMASLAAATYLQYFGWVETSATVDQSVLLDGQEYTTPVNHQFSVIAGCTKCFNHTLENTGCQEVEVGVDTNATPDMDGISIYFKDGLGDPLAFPQTLQPEQMLNFTICYEFDPYLQGEVYSISTYFTTPYY